MQFIKVFHFHKHLAASLILLLASVCFAQESQDKPSLGVLSVEFVPKTTDAVQVELYTSMVRGTVVELARDSVDVIEGSKLDKLIQVNAVGCTNTDCLVQFAKKAQVDYLLETRVIVHKGVYSVNMKLACSKSSSLLSEKTVTYGSEAEAQKGLPTLSEVVVKSLVKGAHAAASDQNGGVEDVPLALPPAGATKVIVKFGSVPPDASVTLDGKILCQTPKEKAVLQGEHWVEMGKDGYRSQREKVTVNRNGQELSWSLVPIQTRLSLDAVDDRTGNDLIADVYVDGTRVGQTPYNGLVAVSAGRIEVVPEGFDRQTVSVALEEGKTAQATAHFRSVEKPKVPSGMVLIPAGCFQMGSTDGNDDEKPVHQVCLAAFSMDKYDVTQGAYRAATGKNPSNFSNCGDNCPVEQVNWNEAKAYCESQGKRLPTEAEWEYAARAGTTTKWYWGNNEGDIGRYAWYSSNSGNTTHPVGQKEPNAWGLYDMAGNVWQWTADWYGTYQAGSQRNPTGPGSGSSRVNRGGSRNYDPAYLRSALRSHNSPGHRNGYLGFRCVSP